MDGVVQLPQPIIASLPPQQPFSPLILPPHGDSHGALASDSCGWVHEGSPHSATTTTTTISAPPKKKGRFTIAMSLDGTLVAMRYLTTTTAATHRRNMIHEGFSLTTPNAILTCHTFGSKSSSPDGIETVEVYYRPHLVQFIAGVSKHFEIVIFSTCEQDYVDALLDVMDPSGELFPKSRRYYRQHCTKVACWGRSPIQSSYGPGDGPVHHETGCGNPCGKVQPTTFLAKDLRMLGLPLSDAILVDDTTSSGFLQPSNLLLLPTWTGNPTDTTLLKLKDKLISISTRHTNNNNKDTANGPTAT